MRFLRVTVCFKRESVSGFLLVCTQACLFQRERTFWIGWKRGYFSGQSFDFIFRVTFFRFLPDLSCLTFPSGRSSACRTGHVFIAFLIMAYR